MPNPDHYEWAKRLANAVNSGLDHIVVSPMEYQQLLSIDPYDLDYLLFALIRNEDRGKELRVVVRYPPGFTTIRLRIEPGIQSPSTKEAE